jgi:regulator of RNase E activity RraA
VSGEDTVFADADGVVFMPNGRVQQLLVAARAIWETERPQADALTSGTTLRDQFRFPEYLKRRTADPAYTFRRHLREHGHSIEE